MATHDSSAGLLDRLYPACPEQGEMIPHQADRVESEAVSFTNRLILRRLFFRPVSGRGEMRFLDDMSNPVYLDGKPTSIEQAVAQADVRLFPSAVSDYLKFYFENCDGGKLSILEARITHQDVHRFTDEREAPVVRFHVELLGNWEGATVNLALRVLESGKVERDSLTVAKDGIPG